MSKAKRSNVKKKSAKKQRAELNHTPGPWVAREQMSTGRKSLGWIIEHGNGRIGWSSYATAKPNEGEAAPFPISAANAQLIAASPELYEACKAAWEELDWHEAGGHPSKATKLLSAALAKAKPPTE